MKEILQPSSNIAFFLWQGFQWSVSHKACQEFRQGSLSYRVLLGSALNSRSAIVLFPNVQQGFKYRGHAFKEGEGEVRIPIIMGEIPIP